MGTNQKTALNSPVSSAFEPVENVSASGVVDLVKWVSIGFLDGHSIAKREDIQDTDTIIVNVTGHIHCFVNVDVITSMLVKNKSVQILSVLMSS